jgi:AraC-like DNA-binding protein
VRSAETIAAVRAYHTTPAEAGRVAREAGVKCLVLNHFVPTKFDRASVLDEVRRRRARAVLDVGAMSMSELALLLDFSELSALPRAYRRWFGKPARRPQASRVKEPVSAVK